MGILVFVMGAMLLVAVGVLGGMDYLQSYHECSVSFFSVGFIRSFYLHPVAWLLFEVYPVFIFSNGITLQTRALTEKKLHNNLLGIRTSLWNGI